MFVCLGNQEAFAAFLLGLCNVALSIQSRPCPESSLFALGFTFHQQYCARYREKEPRLCFSSQRGYRRCDINHAAFIGRDCHPLTHIVR
ncbi:hypothetical protein V8C44DRAFT_32889 [Trichoderma aethiopicum]